MHPDKPKTVNRQRSNKTRKFVVTKGLQGEFLAAEARKYLASKGLEARDVMMKLGRKSDGTPTRGSKKVGPFVFRCERTNNGEGKGDRVFLYVHYKDSSERYGTQINSMLD
jgi:hypothetical protein